MRHLVLHSIWVLALVGVFFLTSSFEQNTTQFYGLTENHEQAVRFQEPVKITQIMVIEGQLVERGTVLLRARRSELDSQEVELKGQIDELNARHSQTNSTLSSEIRVLKAKHNSELAKIDMQIHHLQSKRQQNYALYKNITGNNVPSSNTGGDLIQEEINDLITQKSYITSSFNAQINALKTQISASNNPTLVQQKQLSERLDEINRKTDELTIRANFTGRIGSISFKEGERISSFQSVLTVHGLYPKFIKGYIHENVSNDVKIGQRVWVHALAVKNQKPVVARVESLGKRIVPYPERLRKNPQIQSWGREVIIRLANNNPLLLGEKVQVSYSQERPNSAVAFFNPFGDKAPKKAPTTFMYDKGITLGSDNE